MTLRHLKIYLQVYQTENITRAAEALSMTQPAVTRAIQEIERYYGIRLFERINRRLRVTETGKVFYTYAVHIVDSFGQMEKRLRNWEELGVLRVGTSVTIGNSLLPGVIKEFQQKHPELQIRSYVSNGRHLQQAILDNRLDFAVVEGNIDNGNLCQEKIAADRMILILPPEDSRRNRKILCMKDLEQDALLLREEGSMGRLLVDRVFALHGMTPHPVMESVSTQAIIRAVHAGLGISFLPERLVRPAIAAGTVAAHDLADEAFVRENYIVWHRHKFLSSSARELMDCFRRASDERSPEKEQNKA